MCRGRQFQGIFRPTTPSRRCAHRSPQMSDGHLLSRSRLPPAPRNSCIAPQESPSVGPVAGASIPRNPLGFRSDSRGARGGGAAQVSAWFSRSKVRFRDFFAPHAPCHGRRVPSSPRPISRSADVRSFFDLTASVFRCAGCVSSDSRRLFVQRAKRQDDPLDRKSTRLNSSHSSVSRMPSSA